MTDNRTTMSRFKRWRETRKLKRQIVALGTFIGNHGWYPGVVDDCKRLEAMERELDEVAEKWGIAQVEAEVCAKRCMLLEQLVRDMESDLRQWRSVFILTANTERIGEIERFYERMTELGIEVD